MWIIYSLLAALSAATVVTLSKAGLKNVAPNLGFAIQAVMILLVSWTFVLAQGGQKDLANIGGKSWIYLLAAGIITCLSSLLSFRALSIADASQVSSFDKISLVFSIILAVIFLKERLTWQIAFGALLMASGALVISFSSNSKN